MAPELRKRKAPPPAPEPPAKKPAKSKVAKVAETVKEAVVGKPAKAAPKTTAKGSVAATDAASAPADAPTLAAIAGAGKPVVGETISLEGFGGEIQTNDGTKTTLKALVDGSKAGVVLFTYPKASTPGCKLLVLNVLSCHVKPVLAQVICAG